VKVVIFAEDTKITNPFVIMAKKTYPDALVWNTSYQKDLAYFVKVKDTRIYEKVLDYCFDNDVDLLYIVYLFNVEYLLAELTARISMKKFKTRIVFGTDWRYLTLSDARTIASATLMQYVWRVVVLSNSKATYPGKLCKEFFENNSKIVVTYSPFYADIKPRSKEKARYKLGLPSNKFIYLFFGAMHYGKGLDILVKAFKQVNIRNSLLYIVSAKTLLNFDFDFKELETDNIIWRSDKIEDNQLSNVFASCDAVVLPYRRSYINSGSSVLTQSSQAHRPVVMSAYPPCEKVVLKYNLGVLFESENQNALVEALSCMKMTKYYFDLYAKYDECISEIPTWDQYSKIFFE
jgi:glycosyltransferase involved in cell wall biosynthesis